MPAPYALHKDRQSCLHASYRPVIKAQKACLQKQHQAVIYLRMRGRMAVTRASQACLEREAWLDADVDGAGSTIT